MSLCLVLLNQHGQVPGDKAVVLVAVAISAVAGVSGAVLVPRQPFTVAGFEGHQPFAVAVLADHRLSGALTLAVEVLADQVSHLDSIMVVVVCLRCGQMDSLAQPVGP